MNVVSPVPVTKPRRYKVASLQSLDPAGNTGNTQKTLNRLTGLGPMTGVMTSLGSFPAQVLRERDRVLTKGGKFLPITSVTRMTFDADYLGYHPGAQPVLIRAGALAQGVPGTDVLLAPFQKFHPQQPFCKPGLLVAIDALQRPHVCRKPESIITYTTIGFGQPATICCDGLWIDVAA